MITILSIFVSVFVVSWYIYFRYRFTYWKKRGVPTGETCFPAGSITNALIGRENLYETIANYYKEFKDKGYRHGGIYFFNGPIYLPVDLVIIKHILTIDFEHFVDRGVYNNEEKFPLSGGLFSLEGSRWKNLRHKISPAFSSGKLKNMYEIFLKTTDHFINAVDLASKGNGEINIKHISANFTTDIIFSVAFGLDSETLKQPHNYLGKIVKTVGYPSIWALIKTIALEGFQNPGNLLRVLAEDRKPQDFFSDILENQMKYRKNNKIQRNDFLSLLLEIKETEGLTFNEILAQCFVFFAAGFETSSQTISCCIHELAHNQEIQDKLRAEIFDKMGRDFTKFTYDDVLNLPYLNKVFHETLRLYPVLGFLNRICVKPYKVPGTDLIIEKGTPVLISTLGIQRNSEYFPDPLKFDPERFNDKSTVTPFSFLPFGEGPRFCIGMRHGKLQTMLGIASLISQFNFSPSPTTPKHIKFAKLVRTIVMIPPKGITVIAKKI